MGEMFWDGEFEWQEAAHVRAEKVLDFLNRYTSQFLSIDVPNEIDYPECLLIRREEALRIGFSEDGNYDIDIDDDELDALLSKAINPNSN